MKIIGFAGAIGAGKDESSNYIHANYPNVVQLKLAHPLQDMVATLGGFYKEDLSHRYKFNDRHWKENEAILVVGDFVYTPRLLMRELGERLRAMNPHFWTSILDNSLLSIANDAIVCVSDVRDKNDCGWVQSFSNGKLVYIQNDRAELAFYEKNKVIHTSEQYLDYAREKADFVVNNNSSLDYLYEHLDRVLL